MLGFQSSGLRRIRKGQSKLEERVLTTMSNKTAWAFAERSRMESFPGFVVDRSSLWPDMATSHGITGSPNPSGQRSVGCELSMHRSVADGQLEL